MKHNKSFIQIYKWILLSILLLVIVIYIAIYFIFKGKGLISAEINLEKRDWLAFVGGYLSFAGTLCVSVISILQTDYHNRKESESEKKQREETISPRFSLSLNGVSDNNNSFSIMLQNIGNYPITSVIINDTPFVDFLKPNESKVVKFSYAEEVCIKLLESVYEKDGSGYAKDIVINYDDIDGHMCFQIFKLKTFEGVLYYSFEYKEKVI